MCISRPLMSVRGRLSLLPRCVSCELPLTQISAKHCTLIPLPFTLYPESGNRDWVRGNRRIKEQDTGFDVSPSDSPLPFPDSGMLLRGIGGLTFPDSYFMNQVLIINLEPILNG